MADAEKVLGNDGEAEPKGNTTLTGDDDKNLSAEEKADAVAEAAKKEAADKAAADKEGDDDGEKKKKKEADHDTDKKSADSDADADKDGAPTEYAEFKMPEGLEVDKDALAEFTPIMLEVKATQEQAQAAVDVGSKMVEKALKAQATAWADREAKWTETAETDKEIGGKDYDKNVMLARGAIRQIGGKPLMKAIEDCHAGNHPEIVRVFVRLAKAIGEDNIDFGGVNAGGGKTLAQRMFPNQGKK